MKQIQDTDYLYATSRVRSLENKMLSERDFKHMIEARTPEEAYKIINDAGIGANLSIDQYEEALTRSLREAYDTVRKIVKDPGIVDIFLYQYDGHNAKVLVKAQAGDLDATPLLSPLGLADEKTIESEFTNKHFDKLNKTIAGACLEAVDLLARSHDPQLVDILIDKAVYAAKLEKGLEFDNRFLHKMLRAEIDISNIRSTVRVKRMGKDATLLKTALVEGGTIPTAKFINILPKSFDEFFTLLSTTEYNRYLEESYDDLRSGATLTRFEKVWDNYTIKKLSDTRAKAFGLEPVIAYLYAKENEVRSARIVMASKMAGVSGEQISERLRECYA